jgi:23S rRNA pseudouridine1911/1915/1917 synthase
MRIKISIKQAGERIDKFLVKKLKKFSRGELQKLIKEEKIIVNNKKISPHYCLKEGDFVETAVAQKKRQPAVFPLIKPIGEQTEESMLEIIDETPEFIVVNKPAGIIMHGAGHIKEISLADLILKKYPEIKKVGDDPFRPGIVHRLDREASGLVVIAKTNDSFDNLKKQFKERTVIKEYLALVHGRVEKEAGILNFPIKRSRAGGKMSALPLLVKGEKNMEGRRAVTEFEVIKRYKDYVLVKLIIKTGRTHQIRAHLSAYGHPLVGDNLYGTKKTRVKNIRLLSQVKLRGQEKLNSERIFLAAVKLSFKDLNGERKTYKMDMPVELKKMLEKIK